MAHKGPDNRTKGDFQQAGCFSKVIYGEADQAAPIMTLVQPLSEAIPGQA
jgi:hypothetical protein